MDCIEVTPALTMFRIGGWQAYLVDDGAQRLLIDTGAPAGAADLLSACGTPDLVILTHCHVDHCGAAAAVHERTGAPIAAGAADAEVVRGGLAAAPPNFEEWELPIHQRVAADLPPAAPPAPVSLELRGTEVLDIVGGAHVIATPGHTDGSIAIHLPAHGIVFTGDTVANVGEVTLGVFNRDRTRTAESFRALADIDCQTACFGHGEPIAVGAGRLLRDAARRLD
ncbi:MBL fold metallo-hydrolase [Mycobacterium sp. shizuoka-1]|uniref:MBL fold metallo-hydrolase n=1 Tax=Mycobacterium sp. shizuoka-1 TaxID=2039281 RepID=UPI000C067749|nr:MBL fold metallo-hydrolase [Mycobacterium sp. shizuoka-1]GAY13836.1 MBL fold metallo-hydrolase [Mycobacterium sp. shizuoka-1]